MFYKSDSRTWQVNTMLNKFHLALTYTHLQITDYEYEQATGQPTNQPTNQKNKNRNRLKP